MSSSTTSRGSSVDLPTLVVTAVASAVAAYVTSKLWTPGTLGAAAFTPVLIALLKEGLARPADIVTRAVPVRGVVRSSGGPDDADLPVAGQLPHTAAGGEGGSPEQIEARIAQIGEARGPSRRAPGHAWKAAVVTGLLGFLVAAAIITVPELVAGGSAAGGGRGTTFFGGGSSSATDPATTTETTEQTPSDTPTTPLDETITVAPADTVTVPPAAVPVPVPPVDPGTEPQPTDTDPTVPPPP